MLESAIPLLSGLAPGYCFFTGVEITCAVLLVSIRNLSFAWSSTPRLSNFSWLPLSYIVHTITTTAAGTSLSSFPTGFTHRPRTTAHDEPTPRPLLYFSVNHQSNRFF